MNNNQESRRKKPVRVLGTPVAHEGNYRIDTPAKQNKICGWVCPKCHKPVIICPPIAGKMWVTCRTCSTKTQISVAPSEDVTIVENEPEPEPESALEPKPVPPPITAPAPEGIPEPKNATPIATERSASKGQLSWGNIFNRKKMMLPVGQTFIGRNDPDAHSDLEFNDPNMSRRSVRIDVLPMANGGFTYKLNVLKSGNPVLVDNKQIHEGESVMLQGRNAITMGRTVINFKEIN